MFFAFGMGGLNLGQLHLQLLILLHQFEFLFFEGNEVVNLLFMILVAHVSVK